MKRLAVCPTLFLFIHISALNTNFLSSVYQTQTHNIKLDIEVNVNLLIH